MKISNFLIILLLLSSCSGMTKMADRTMPAYQSVEEPIKKSLFNSHDRTISEENIQKLLDGKIIIKDSLRIALFNYSNYSRGSYYYSWNNEEYLKTQQDYIDTLTFEISNARKVNKMILMPSIMANEKSSITNLRETAVRLQADFLMVYTIKSDTYSKYKAFGADQTKAFATVETFVMDTRTGIIPFTTIVTKDSFLKKSSKEINIEELRKNAEKQAITRALTQVGSKLKDFFDSN